MSLNMPRVWYPMAGVMLCNTAQDGYSVTFENIMRKLHSFYFRFRKAASVCFVLDWRYVAACEIKKND